METGRFWLLVRHYLTCAHQTFQFMAKYTVPMFYFPPQCFGVLYLAPFQQQMHCGETDYAAGWVVELSMDKLMIPFKM